MYRNVKIYDHLFHSWCEVKDSLFLIKMKKAVYHQHKDCFYDVHMDGDVGGQ